jgi:pilus assembly protein CpaE
MNITVLSDSTNNMTTLKVLQLLGDCSEGSVPGVVQFAHAPFITLQPGQLVVLVLSPEPEKALQILHDIRPQLSGPVLAIGQATDSRLILRALQEGADHYLDENELAGQLEAALVRLRVKDKEKNELQGKLYCLAGAGGGCGVSTLAASLAVAVARDHQRCILIDLKPGSGDLAALLNLKPTHTLADLCQDANRLDQALFESSLVPHLSGVYLLAPPQDVKQVCVVTPSGVSTTLGLARKLFPAVLIDLDDWFHGEQVAALRKADGVLLVIRLDFTSLRNARRALIHLKQLGLEEDQVQLIVNRYGQPKELPAEEAEQALGKRIDFFIPDDPKTVNTANNTGVPVVIKAPSARITQTIVQAARKLMPAKSEENGTAPAPTERKSRGWFYAFR